jgi:hypothetical protein
MMKANGSRKVREFMQQAEALRSDLGKRIESIGEQLGNWPEPLVFDAKGVAALSKIGTRRMKTAIPRRSTRMRRVARPRCA